MVIVVICGGGCGCNCCCLGVMEARDSGEVTEEAVGEEEGEGGKGGREVRGGGSTRNKKKKKKKILCGEGEEEGKKKWESKRKWGGGGGGENFDYLEERREMKRPERNSKRVGILKGARGVGSEEGEQEEREVDKVHQE